MNVPTPLNDNARDDAFDRGLERLLQGDHGGIEEIEPNLRETALEMVKLANEAGWIGTDPGEEPVRASPWWKNTHHIINAMAAIAVVGLIAVMVTVGVRIWDGGEGGQYGSDPGVWIDTETTPATCSRTPLTGAEIAAIVRKSRDEVEPFQNEVHGNVTSGAMQLTRDWNACLLDHNWHAAMAYESEFFIWLLGEDVFPHGTDGLSDEHIANRVAERHSLIAPLATVDGMNLSVYHMDKFRYLPGEDNPRLRGADVWLVPVTVEGHWIEWFTVMSVEWDGSQWMIVSATRDGVPDSPYFRDDTLPEATPEVVQP